MLVAAVVLLAIATGGLALALRQAVRTSTGRRDQIEAAARHLDSISDTPPRPHGETIVQRSADVAQRIEQYRTTLMHAPFGVVIVDDAQTIIFASAEAERYVKGRHGDAVAEGQIESAIAEAAQRRTETSRDIELYTPTRRVLGLHAIPLNHAERDAGVAVFLEDLTERRRVDAIRKDFVANASHELKTPLGALTVLAETLTDAADAATRSRLTNRISGEAQRMSRLIDDILDLALVEGTSGERSPTALDDVLAEAVKNVAVISEEYAVPIDVTSEPSVILAGDHRQLVSAVSNLLENAIKYTYASGKDALEPVEVRASAVGDVAVIEIEDHGIGISRQHLSRIFERFYRVDPARSRRTGGTGLGLAIVRHVVMNHEGTIEVESEPSTGSTFRITIPTWSQ